VKPICSGVDASKDNGRQFSTKIVVDIYVVIKQTYSGYLGEFNLTMVQSTHIADPMSFEKTVDCII
jgi:hypothetical protein